MAYIAPKTDWMAADAPTKDDFNRIEGNIADLNSTKETVTGAQEKANTAESAARQYTDTHAEDSVKHITAEERIAWNAKETPAGAQQKANEAAQAVADYVDQSKVSIGCTWGDLKGATQ